MSIYENMEALCVITHPVLTTAGSYKYVQPTDILNSLLIGIMLPVTQYSKRNRLVCAVP